MEKVHMLQSWIRHATNKWVLCAAQKNTVWQNRVILTASSHSHYNSISLFSPRPHQITKLKLPSTSHSLNLAAQETASKCFFMSETIQYLLCFLKHPRAEIFRYGDALSDFSLPSDELINLGHQV